MTAVRFETVFTLLLYAQVTRKSGARTKEPIKGGGEVPHIRIENIDVVPVRLSAPPTRSPRVLVRENKVAPQDGNSRLPTIREYGEFIAEKQQSDTEKSSSTRIRYVIVSLGTFKKWEKS